MVRRLDNKDTKHALWRSRTEAVEFPIWVTDTGHRPAVAVSFVTTSVEAHFRLIEKRHGIHLLREVIHQIIS
jgi:hypothetical protein